jgi:hypothetical protein
LTVASIVLAGAALYSSSLGCLGLQGARSYFITLNPPRIVVSKPGEAHQVQALLKWNVGDEVRDLEAQSWSLTASTPPPVLSSATLNPTQESIYSDLSLTVVNDAAKLVPSNDWVASGSNSHQIGVHASFVDLQWKSISGQTVVVGRTAFLPILVPSSRVEITFDSVEYTSPIHRTPRFNAYVGQPTPGWTYRIDCSVRTVLKTTGAEFTAYSVGGTTLSSAKPSDLMTLPSASVEMTNYYQFQIEYVAPDGTVVRKDAKTLRA